MVLSIVVAILIPNTFLRYFQPTMLRISIHLARIVAEDSFYRTTPLPFFAESSKTLSHSHMAKSQDSFYMLRARMITDRFLRRAMLS
jgi:hypothetical protein